MISHSQEVKTLFSAIKRIAPELSEVHKSGRNQAQNYDYAKLEDYINTIKPLLEREGCVVVFSADGIRSKVKEAYSRQHVGVVEGYNHYASVSISCRLLHLESGEWIEVKSLGEGVDRGDKATYKAITGGRKYALAMLLNLVTTDDPEADEEVDRRNHVSIAQPERRLARTSGGQSNGSVDLSILEKAGVKITTEQNGQYTNFIASGISEPIGKVLPDWLLKETVRKSKEPRDPNKGMWIGIGRISFTRESLDVFKTKVAEYVDAKLPPLEPADNGSIGSYDSPF